MLEVTTYPIPPTFNVDQPYGCKGFAVFAKDRTGWVYVIDGAINAEVDGEVICRTSDVNEAVEAILRA